MALDLSSLKRAITSLDKAIKITSAVHLKNQVDTDEEEVQQFPR